MTRSSEGRIGRSLPLLPAVWDCPAEFRARLGAQAGGQRMLTANEDILLVLHAPPKDHQPERVGRFFWRNGSGEWSSSHQGSGPGGMMKLLSEYEKELDG